MIMELLSTTYHPPNHNPLATSPASYQHVPGLNSGKDGSISMADEVGQGPTDLALLKDR